MEKELNWILKTFIYHTIQKSAEICFIGVNDMITGTLLTPCHGDEMEIYT